jgi:cyclopropane fatty-acyl-phospholipid synthase-like methyltransferase
MPELFDTTREAAAMSRTDHNRWVASYYDRCYPYHRLVWTSAQDLALHVGYWDAGTRSHRQSLINLNRVLAERAGIRASDQVVDAGCGIGGSAIWLAETYGCSVVGMTLSRQQAQHARTHALRRGVAQLARFTTQDYTWMALPDASIDVVWAIESVYHAQHKNDFFTEAARVLRPGGRLIIADWLRSRRPHAPDDEQLLGGWLAAWAAPDLGTPAEYLAGMRAVGLIDLRFEDITQYMRRSLRRGYLMAIPAAPAARTLAELGLLPVWDAHNIQGAYDQYIALSRGLWLHGLFSARKP